MPNLIFAHAGHGVAEGHSLAHYFTEPIHVVMLVVCAGAVAVVTRQFIRRMQIKKMRTQRVRKHR